VLSVAQFFHIIVITICRITKVAVLHEWFRRYGPTVSCYVKI